MLPTRRTLLSLLSALPTIDSAHAQLGRSQAEPNQHVTSAKDFGAVGDGSADDTSALQAALDSSFGNRTSQLRTTEYRTLFIPAGNYKITAPLILESLHGGCIFGAGRFATKIVNVAGNGSVFATNGCQYSRFENFHISGNENSVLFDLDWDNTGTALQSNTFANIYFQGGAYGIRIGNTGYMGSENLFQNCAFAGNTIAGISTRCFNALQQTIIGGNFQNCGIGVHVWKGSAPIIHGAGFQQNTWDIKVDNGANDAMSIQGCRTESDNFANIRYQAVNITGCTQYASSTKLGIFLECRRGSFSIDSCITVGGRIILTSGGGEVRCSQFGRDDWVETDGDRINVSKVFIGKTLVKSGTGTPAVLERGYVAGRSFTPS